MQQPSFNTLLNSFISTLIANSGVTSLTDTARATGIGNAASYASMAVLTWIQTQLPQDILAGLQQMFGISPLPATASSVNLTFTGTPNTVVPQGTQVSTVGDATTPAILFQTSAAATISSSGSVSVAAVSLSTGTATNVEPNSIIVLATGVSGVSSVTNPEAAAGGANIESPTSQLARFQLFLQNLAASTAPNIQYQLSKISGVQTLAVVSPAYFSGFAYEGTGATWVDDSIETNFPKGVPFTPFPGSPLTVNDAFYIGADRAFSSFYLDVATAGAGLSAQWQYWNGSSWAPLVLTDNTANGQQSGTAYWTVPTDWTMTTVNNTVAFWVRLALTSTTVTTIPTWYQVMSLDPPAPFCYVFVQVLPGQTVSTVLAAVSAAAPQYAAPGTTAIVKQPQTYPLNITYSVIPTALGSEQTDLITQINQNISTMFSNLTIGQFLPVSDIYSAISSTGNGQYIQQVSVAVPASDTYVGADTLITEGTVTGTITG